MAELNNFRLTSSNLKNEGSKGGRAWKLYNFTIDFPGWENETFSYFQSGKKATPQAGMEVKSMEFNEEINEYDEYTANLLTPAERAAGSRRITPAGPAPQVRATPMPAPPKVDTKMISILASYHKDLSVAKLTHLTAEEAMAIDSGQLLNDAVSAACTCYGMIESFKETFHAMRNGQKEAAPEEAPEGEGDVPEFVG
jgi:hypothetical protein